MADFYFSGHSFFKPPRNISLTVEVAMNIVIPGYE